MAEQICRRCNEPVASPDFELFEKMHYVCFHYEFEHRGDVDEQCTAGGCPSSRTVTPRDPATPALEPGELGFVGVTYVEERNGKALVRLPNGSKTSVRFGSIERSNGTDFHFVAGTHGAGEHVRCLICDWAAELDTRVEAETAALTHRVRCPTETT